MHGFPTFPRPQSCILGRGIARCPLHVTCLKEMSGFACWVIGPAILELILVDGGG